MLFAGKLTDRLNIEANSFLASPNKHTQLAGKLALLGPHNWRHHITTFRDETDWLFELSEPGDSRQHLTRALHRQLSFRRHSGDLVLQATITDFSPTTYTVLRLEHSAGNTKLEVLKASSEISNDDQIAFVRGAIEHVELEVMPLITATTD